MQHYKRKTNVKRSYRTRRTGYVRRSGLKRTTRSYRGKARYTRKGYTRLSKTIQRPIYNSDIQYVKMRYHGYFPFTFSYASATPQLWVFSGNSIRDPDVTGGGHYPYGYQKWQGMYDYYDVLGSSISVKSSTSLITNQNSGFKVSILPIDTGASIVSAYGDYQSIQEIPRLRTQEVFTYSGSHRPLKQYCATHIPFCLSKNECRTDPDFRSDFTHDPTKRWFWQLVIHPLTNAAEVACEIQCEVDIIYFVKIFHRKLVTYVTDNSLNP